jgi:hypothetical protein
VGVGVEVTVGSGELLGVIVKVGRGVTVIAGSGVTLGRAVF